MVPWYGLKILLKFEFATFDLMAGFQDFAKIGTKVEFNLPAYNFAYTLRSSIWFPSIGNTLNW